MRFAAVLVVAFACSGALASVCVKVTLCHIPPGNPTNARTIVVRQAAVESHLGHGDYLGECDQSCTGVPSPLPKSGQTECRSVSSPYEQIDCTGTGQDGEHQVGVSVSPRFIDKLDGTVLDNLTGLIWLREWACLGQTDWSAARDAANTLADGACGLADGSVAGDWRLPNIRELQSVVDFGQSNPALPAAHPFSPPQTYYWYYWSSTQAAAFPQAMWCLHLVDGSTIAASFYNDMRVWPVRGGQ